MKQYTKKKLIKKETKASPVPDEPKQKKMKIKKASLKVKGEVEPPKVSGETSIVGKPWGEIQVELR